MRIYSRLILCIICLIGFHVMHGQNEVLGDEKNALAITAYNGQDGVKLRWGPTTPIAWTTCLKSGYVVTRTTMTRDGEMVSLEERKSKIRMSPVPFKHMPKEAWESLVDESDNAAVAAQAIFGERFIIETGDEKNQNDMLINAQTESKNRFSFGLFAADQSFELAQAMGLAWTDTTVKENENYIYQVFPASVSDVAIDTGLVYVRTKEKMLLPKIVDLGAKFSNLRVMLNWNLAIGGNFFTSYEVEQSFDGQSWGVRTTTPFVPILKNEDDEKAFYGDTIPYNNRPIFYRVRGKTIFDEYGPYSDVVHGSGIDALPSFFPEISGITETDKGEMEIRWGFNQSDESKLIGFNIYRSDDPHGGYIQLNETLMSSDVRSFTDVNPMPSNYYKIKGIELHGREIESFPGFMALHDETPPAPPQNVRGRITMNGDLIIFWDKNEEEDFMGNRVYIANHPKAEFSQITIEPVTNGYFMHRVTLQTLTENVFVQVVSLDYRHNSSKFSEIAKISRPDTIPPVAPRFVSYDSNTKGASFSWMNSSSTDVDRQELHRRKLGSNEWELVNTFKFPEDINIESHTDSNTAVKDIFEYRLDAIDDADLRTSSELLQIKIIDDYIRDSISNIQIEVDRKQKFVKLTWGYSIIENLEYFQIYRALKDKPAVTYKTISLRESVVSVQKKKNSAQFQFIDNNVQMNTEYSYSVKAKYSDGAQSPLSHLITISY